LVLIAISGLVDRRNRSLKNFQGSYQESNLEPPVLWCSLSSCDGKKISQRFALVRHMLGKNSEYRDHYSNHPVLPPVLVDWILLAISTGLLHLTDSCNVMHVQLEVLCAKKE
jgi:hypothetical protein